jgi:hypothetical protein
MKGKLPIRAILISVAVLGGLVALYNVFGYLYNFNQGWPACAMHLFNGGQYGGILGILIPLAFSLVSIALVAVVLRAVPGDTAADRPAMKPCPHCGRPLQADWRACPYCAWMPAGGEVA